MVGKYLGVDSASIPPTLVEHVHEKQGIPNLTHSQFGSPYIHGIRGYPWIPDTNGHPRKSMDIHGPLVKFGLTVGLF
jgi:hypothetical protein